MGSVKILQNYSDCLLQQCVLYPKMQGVENMFTLGGNYFGIL